MEDSGLLDNFTIRREGHYLEFTFGIISSLIDFWFIMDDKVSCFTVSELYYLLKDQTNLDLPDNDLKFVCGKGIGQIHYGTHHDCNICVGSSKEFPGTYLNKPIISRYGSI